MNRSTLRTTALAVVGIGTTLSLLSAFAEPLRESLRGPLAAVSRFVADPAVQVRRVPSGTGSYANARFAIRSGRRPIPDAVRVSEWLNVFSLSNTDAHAALELELEAAPSPLRKGPLLVRVSTSLPLTASSQALAVDVQFDPDTVASYRLLGSNGPGVPGTVERFEADVVPGGAFQAFFEVEPKPNATPRARAVARSSGGAPVSQPSETAGKLRASRVRRTFAHATDDFRFGSVVALTADLARQGQLTRSSIIDLRVGAVDAFLNRDREELLGLLGRLSEMPEETATLATASGYY